MQNKAEAPRIKTNTPEAPCQNESGAAAESPQKCDIKISIGTLMTLDNMATGKDKKKSRYFLIPEILLR